jgi:hypothetical protein
VDGTGGAEIETDYLVVGAGASGMAFVDALLAADPEATFVLADRRHRPGGHWLDAYPFVRLHQPSAYYGVCSRALGQDRIDDHGPNAGFYERASAAEICDYFGRVLDEHLLPSGRVRFLGLTDYLGGDADAHHVASLLTGAATTVRVRRRLVDATYVHSEIPSRHRPEFEVDAGVRLIPPNDLVDLDHPVKGFTVIGAGKTAMDTCNWLLEIGVDPERIRWLRPRDSWLFERSFMQPLELVARYMEMQAHWVEAAAETRDGADFARRLEERGVFIRIDPEVEPGMHRGATISKLEVESLQTIRRVVRKGRVRRLEPRRVHLDGGEELAEPGEVYVDCTAQGVRSAPLRPVFEGGRITLEYVTVGIVPWSAATVGAVEALGQADETNNRLCPPLVFTGDTADLLGLAYSGMSGLVSRLGVPELSAWNENCRLNPARGAMQRLDDPRVVASLASMMTNTGPALRNLRRRATAGEGAVR